MAQMRRFAFGLLNRCGLVAALRWWHRDALTILLYHGVAPRESRDDIYNYRGKFIEPQHFERQLQFLKQHYHLLPLEEALEHMVRGTLPPYSLAITFDDGYENNYRYAFPILKKLGVTATIFVTTDFVFDKKPLWVDRLEYGIGGTQGSKTERIAEDARSREKLKTLPNDEKETRLREIGSQSRTLVDFGDERAVYAPLTLPQIEEMLAAGIAIGAHTRSHPILAPYAGGADGRDRRFETHARTKRHQAVVRLRLSQRPAR